LDQEYHTTDELDQYGRKESIRIYGIPEDFASEEDDEERKLLEIAAKLDIPIDATHNLQQVHRLGTKPKTAKANPRGIIARFVSYKKRQEFIENRKKLNSTKTSICEYLTPTRYKFYNSIRKHENVESVYVTNGLLIVSYKNEWFTVKSSNGLFKLDIDVNWHELGVPFLAGLHAELVDAAESFRAFSGGDC